MEFDTFKTWMEELSKEINISKESINALYNLCVKAYDEGYSDGYCQRAIDDEQEDYQYGNVEPEDV